MRNAVKSMTGIVAGTTAAQFKAKLEPIRKANSSYSGCAETVLKVTSEAKFKTSAADIYTDGETHYKTTEDDGFLSSATPAD